MTQFRDSFYALVPPFLSTGVGERYMYTLELMRDLLMEKANQAVKIRLPGLGDISQIPYLAYDRELVQGPLEPDASFLVRIGGAFETWDHAGSALAVLGQLQAYAQGHSTADLPQFAIVSAPRLPPSLGPPAASVTTWWTLDYDDPIGAPPLLSTVQGNFNWDGGPGSWRTWLVIYQHLDAPTLSGAVAMITDSGGGSFTVPGELVAGVWVPKTSGTPINSPFLTLDGLAGLLPEHVGSILTVAAVSDPTDGGMLQVVQVLSGTSCVVANSLGLTILSTGPFNWTLAAYPWMPPGLAWGSPDVVWGDGEEVIPDVDTGENFGGVWQPTTRPSAGERPTYSWGVRVGTLELEVIRDLVRTWKSSGTYYPNFVICYDGVNDADPTLAAYSRIGSGGNPDGTFGPVGKIDAGVWVPTRLISSPWDCYLQGTGRAVACSLENVT